jgi:hypothetical protein
MDAISVAELIQSYYVWGSRGSNFVESFTVGVSGRMLRRFLMELALTTRTVETFILIELLGFGLHLWHLATTFRSFPSFNFTFVDPS